MITSISPESLTTLSDEALWALFDEINVLLDELPLGSWGCGIVRANLRLVQEALDERRRFKATTPAR